jgi:hypothetical protein
MSIPAAKAAVTPSGFFLKVYKFAVSENADCSNPVVVYENATPDYVDFTSDPTIASSTIKDGTYPCVIIEMSDAIRFVPGETEGACTKGTAYMLDVCADHGHDPGGPPGDGGGPPGSSGGGPPGDGGGPPGSSGGGPPGGGGGPPGGGGGSPGSSGGPPGSGGGGPQGPSGPPSTRLIDGTVVACSAASGTEDRVALYISTASTRVPGSGDQGNAFEPPGAEGKNGFPLGAALLVKGSAVGTFAVDARGKVESTNYGPGGSPQCDMQPPVFSFE